MTTRVVGRLDWGYRRGEDLHRHYWVKFLVETDLWADGPQVIYNTPGLPTIGSSWLYGNDNDQYAKCLPTMQCDTIIKSEPNYYWVLTYNFTTKPWYACASVPITDPLSAPDRISGSFVNETEKINHDINNKPFISSSLEPVWVNKDRHKGTVNITQTVLNLELSTFTGMINTLNDNTLWGMPARTIKLRNVPWRRLVWGLCTYYYERTLSFEVDPKTFDETEILDVGHRWIDPDKLKADPLLDRSDPRNFIRSSDARGNINKAVLLNGNGEICTDPTNHTHYIPGLPKQKYGESNFLLLGIPTTL